MKDHDMGALGNEMPSDWIQLKLVQWQAEFSESSRIPDGIDHLLQVLGQPPASAEDKEFGKLLSLIIHDTLQGVDISRRYPAFFERLITDAVLRETFLDTLEILELTRSGELEPLPGEPSTDLSFLDQQPARPRLHLADAANWRVVWGQTAGQINTLFSNYHSQPPKTLYRGAADWLDDDHITLLEENMTIGQEQYQIVLKATQPVDQPEYLTLSLLVIPTSQTPVTLEAELEWGSYSETLTLDPYGRGRFTAVPITAVLDPSGQKVTGSLHLEFGPAVTS